MDANPAEAAAAATTSAAEVRATLPCLRNRAPLIIGPSNDD